MTEATAIIITTPNPIPVSVRDGINEAAEAAAALFLAVQGALLLHELGGTAAAALPRAAYDLHTRLQELSSAAERAT